MDDASFEQIPISDLESCSVESASSVQSSASLFSVKQYSCETVCLSVSGLLNYSVISFCLKCLHSSCIYVGLLSFPGVDLGPRVWSCVCGVCVFFFERENAWLDVYVGCRFCV